MFSALSGVGVQGGRRLAPTTAHPSSLAEHPLCRQTPEVGAGCGKSARPDLCGGRPATDVPTANEPLEVGDDPFAIGLRHSWAPLRETCQRINPPPAAPAGSRAPLP